MKSEIDYRGMLLLDVDGPLNPYDGTNKPRQRAGYRKHRMSPAGWDGPAALSVWLNPAHGPLLLALAEEYRLELVWCTTWMHEANTWIGRRIGLPSLPVIEFDPAGEDWKYAAVAEYADGCPVAWLDDDFHLHLDALARFEKTRGDVPTLLQTVSPVTGLAEEDIKAVKTWATCL